MNQAYLWRRQTLDLFRNIPPFDGNCPFSERFETIELSVFAAEFVKIIEKEVKDERRKAIHATIDLLFACRALEKEPTTKDLIKLAKRIRGNK